VEDNKRSNSGIKFSSTERARTAKAAEMKQLVQTLKDGRIQVIEIPPPIIGSGMVLVKNHFSLISPGTEGSTVRVAQKSLIGKAKERPQQVRQAIEFLKQQGPVQTYKTVMSKLDAYSPLGYSSVGEVIDVPPDVKGFTAGDLVACAGAGYANHAEVVAVPHNLCVKLPPDADLKKAAYNTLGAIALQGIRQAELGIGETCAVIGLGLIGQLTCVMLKAGGMRVVGIDIDPGVVDIAADHCADIALVRNEPSIVEKILEFTAGGGVDAVIITAATKSLDPVNFAGLIARKKGKIVIVGDVPTGFDREPYYRKELEVRMSCSYGPGRYDLSYEEKGLDYPFGYVRWTEKRNMEAFQELVYSGKIEVDYLTTHTFDLEKATAAYDIILEKKEPYLGILIRYGAVPREIIRRIAVGPRAPQKKVNLAFIGTGNYAQSFLLPNIPRLADVSLKGVMDSSGTVSRKVAEKYGFEFCTSDESDIFENPEIDTIFIASRHDSHAKYVIKALENGKNAEVEKPLCLTDSELSAIKANYELSQRQSQAPRLMVGFNRRFSPLTNILREHLAEGPMAMIYRINAGPIPADSWIQDREIGGGRIVGEVCHFVDYLTYLNGSLPTSVMAAALVDGSNLEDTLNVSLKFANGSVGTICYFANGPRSLFKEYIEIYQSGLTGIISDFKEIAIYGKKKTYKKKAMSKDKGQKNMIGAFVDSIKQGNPSPIRFEEIYAVTLAAFKIVESLRTNSPVSVC
jgi:predicted dehydrogenase/threonine dehydrogenase-like Zn-dependent dehydrogenase